MSKIVVAYDGLLQKPFLAEHWYKGTVAALASWLPVFWLITYLFNKSLTSGAWLASLLSALILAATVTQYQGFSLDRKKLKFRTYTWVLGVRLGAWQPLPVITRITLRPYDRKHYLPMSESPVATGFSATEHKWQVLLSVENSSVGIIAAYVNEVEARKSANALSSLLGLELLISH